MTFWQWLTQAPAPQQLGLPAVDGSGEVDVEGHGGPGGAPGDFGGETYQPIDPITGKPVPRSNGQPKVFGVSVGTLVWVGVAVVVLNAARNVNTGRR